MLVVNISPNDPHTRHMTYQHSRDSIRRRMSSVVEDRLRFDGDDGTLAYAKAAGIYTEGIEAPLFPDRVVASQTKRDPGQSIIVTFGQSNAANTGAGCYAANGPVYVFNVFDMKFYRAIDPLPGASNGGAAVWGRLGDKLVASGHFPSVLFVPIAVG